MDGLNGAREQWRHRERFDTRTAVGFLSQRDRVCDYNFLYDGFLDSLDRRAGQYRMRRARRHAERALRHQRLRGFYQRATGIDQIVHNQTMLPFYVADN